MKRWTANLALLVLLASAGIALSACTATQAAFSGGRNAASAEDVTELKQRLLELQRQAAVTEVELERLRQQVASLESRLANGSGGESAGAPRGRLRSPEPPVEVSGPQPASGRPRVEARPERLSPTEIIEEDDLDDPEPLEAPIVQNPSEARADELRPAPPLPPQPAQSTGAAITPAAQALYDRGYTLYHQGKYVDAESAFQRFLQSYPNTELADNAQFWIGESRMTRGDVRGALGAFRQVVERYPDGNKVADSLLKSAQAMESLGDRDGARMVYGEVIRRFPASAAAAVAEERRGALP